MKNRVPLFLMFLYACGMFHAGSINASGKGSDHVLSTSKTFFSIRPPFQSHMPEKESLWRDPFLARECGIGGAIQIVPFGGQSTHNKDIARYFTFSNKETLLFAEDDAVNADLRDVNAIHFNIQSTGRNFESEVTFKPKHTFAGVGLDYRQYLHCRNACDKRWWAEISTPLLWVKNKIELEEVITTTSFTPISDDVNSSVIEAFKGLKPFGYLQTAGDLETFTITGEGWNYGKIDGSHSKFRAADIEVKLGYDYIASDIFHAEGYIGGVIPAGNTPKGVYVFEPIVGNEFHGGLMWGGSFGWEIWSGCDRYLHLEFATNGRYLFENTQTRSFDLLYKPWSRYMLVYENFAAATARQPTEGINVFTQKVKVLPRFNRDINSALVYTSGGFQGEIGYNFWAKESEKLKLKNEWVPTVTFAAVQNAAGETGTFPTNVVNPAELIGINNNLEAFVAGTQELYDAACFTIDRLDLQSAAAPAVISHTFYGSLGYRSECWCYPIFVGLGGSYELASERGAISRWTVWGKFGVSL